jgi:hypothetical protein
MLLASSTSRLRVSSRLAAMAATATRLTLKVRIGASLTEGQQPVVHSWIGRQAITHSACPCG